MGLQNDLKLQQIAKGIEIASFCKKIYNCIELQNHFNLQPMGLYHPLDGDTNLKYKLLCFLTPNKKIQRERH
jgi:hypothetical protein